MATEQVKVLKIDTAPAEKSVKDLRTELKALKDTMLSCEQGTEEYNKALVQAAEIQHTLKEQMEQVNAVAMDFGQIAQNSVSAIGGIVAGFQAAKATMNLFGIENENVIKALQKMQSLMAITQALPSIEKGVKAFKSLSIAIKAVAAATEGWKKALISTGIGLLVVALGALIANFDKISQWLDEITGQTDFLGEVADNVMGGLEAGWAAIVQSLKAVGNAIVTYVTTPFKAVWNAIQAYTSTNGGFADKLKAAGAAMKNGFVSDWKEVGNDFKEVGTAASSAFQKGYEKNKKKRAEKAKAEAVEEGKEQGTAAGKAKAAAQEAVEEAAYKKRLKNIDANERAEMLALQKLGLSYEEYVKQKEELEDRYAQKRIEALQNILDTEVNLTEEEVERLQEELIKLQDSLYKKPEEESGSGDTATPENNDTKSQEEQTIDAVRNGVALLNDALNEVGDNPAWGNMLSTLSQINDVFLNLISVQKEFGKDSKEYAATATQAYLQIASIGFSAMSQMFQGIAAEQDTSNKKGFETAKKMQIASATMTTLSSVLQALAAGNSMASQMGLAAPVGWALGAAMATMVGALGAVNIAKISKQKFGGGGSTTSGSISTPSTGAINAIQAPVQYTQDVQGASIEGAIKDTKVYVTETDITDTQNKVEVSESEARF